jgi:hypothetical protein
MLSSTAIRNAAELRAAVADVGDALSDITAHWKTTLLATLGGPDGTP